MIVSIHQPAYLPWLGYFEKIARSDLFILLDNVQFQKGSFQNRNKIRTSSGTIWLSVPLKTKGTHFDTMLKDVEIDRHSNWQGKHLKSIKMNYSKAINFDSVFEKIEKYYTQDWIYLTELCFQMTLEFIKMLKITTPIIKASDLKIDGKKSNLILQLCNSVGASTYYSGKMGREYLDIGAFREVGIDIKFQSFSHPIYKQCYPDFEPKLGVIDALFCDPNAEKLIGV